MFMSVKKCSVSTGHAVTQWLEQYASDLANIYFFKFNNRNTRKRCEVCSKLTIKTPEGPFSSVSIADFEQVNVSWVSNVGVLWPEFSHSQLP